jgi:leucyl aminopeptidase
VVTVLELAKVLINSHLQFNKPIYLIWYAAEEEGLIGSGYTVQDFIIKKIAVDAVIQFDMTGFTDHNDLTIWLTKDFTDPGLTSFLETLITTYVKQPVKYTACGYACSDHASWNLHGFKSAYVAEAEMGKDNSYFHTPQDSIEKLSLQHMSDFAKLGVAFAVELAS